MITFYVFFVLPVVAVLSTLIYVPIYIVNRKKHGKRPIIRHLAIYAWIGVVLSILYVTLFIGGLHFQPDAQYRFLNLIPFVWVKETYEMGAKKMLQQLVMNVVMVIPLGFFMPIVFQSLRKWWKTGITIAIFIFCIETIQYFIGRSADIDDLIMNSIGGLIGYVIALLCNKIFNQKKWWLDAMNR